MNKAELVRLKAEQIVIETKKDLECCPCQGPGHTMQECLLKEREFKDAVVHTCLDQKDSCLYQAKTSKNLRRLENKADHLITMTEGEVRSGLREQKLEYELQ